MSSMSDLRRALARFNGLPEGELVDYSEAVKYLADVQGGLGDDEIKFRIGQLEELTPAMDALRRKEKEVSTRPLVEGLDDLSTGKERPYSSTTLGVKISAPRRNSFRGNSAVRVTENEAIRGS